MATFSYALRLITSISEQKHIYYMRARYIPESTLIFWESQNIPDMTGTYSGKPEGDLTDIQVLGTLAK